MRRSLFHSQFSGFALLELVIGMLLTGVLAVVLFGGLLGLKQALLPPMLVLDGEALAESPTYVAMPAALEFHRLFLQHRHGARVAYVLGGRSLGKGQPGHPLQTRSLPDLGRLEFGLPSDAAAFQALYGEQLGSAEPESDIDDFTVLFLGAKDSRLVPVCLVQCRSRSFTQEGRPGRWIRREASLIEEGGNVVRYAFAEPVGSGNRSQVGALHVWHPSLSSDTPAEEGPAFVVFPDPWLFRGSPGETSVPAHSRFMYLIPVERS